MKFLVIGCGSIGRRHMKNLFDLGHNVIAADINPEYRKWVEDNLSLKTFEKAEDGLADDPDACLICTPPSTHIKLAKLVLNSDCHVFIEKPISHNLTDVESTIKLANEKDLRLAVGYNLRFNKSLLKVKELLDSGAIGKPLYARLLIGQYLPEWRPWQDYRKSYTASKKLGGGIILDASHELDYARWLFGDMKYLCCFADKLSNLEVETEDTAEIILRSDSGPIINIHLDFVRRDKSRNCEIIGENGTIKWDGLSGNVNLISFDEKGNQKENVSEITTDANDMYVSEIVHFIECIADKKQLIVDGIEGMKSLELALKSKESSEKSKVFVLGD